MGYKKYLLTGGKIPRQTLWNRRQRALRQQRILQAIQVPLDAGGQSLTQPTIIDNDSLPPDVGDQCQSQSMNTDGENSQTNSIENVQAHMSDESIQLTEESRGLRETSGMTENPTDDIPNRETDMSSPALDTQLQSDNSTQEVIYGSADTNEYDQWSPQQMEFGTSHSDIIINREQLMVPLCSHTSTTAGDVLFMTLALGVKHNISWEGQVDILNMVRSIFESSDIPSTKYQYMKLIDPPSTELTKHIYCTVCDAYLGTTLEFKNGNATCKYCQQVTDTSKELSVFLSASIEAQLQKHMTDPVFVNSLLTNRFTRIKSSAETLEDIYNGVEYRKLFDNGGILSNQYNFNYSFFIDGISLGKSSGKTIWPIFLTINEKF